MQKILENDKNAVSLAVDFLKKGKVISFKTDTVYGLAVDAQNEKAVESLYKIKNRQENKSIAIFLPNIKIAQEIFVFDDLAQKIAKDFDSLPLTMILKKKKGFVNLAKNLNKNDDFLGFRIVKTKFISDLLKNFGGIIAVSSANISGKNAAIEAFEVEKEFLSIENLLVVDGGICKEKIASTVIKIDENKIEILREGAIKKAFFEKYC